MELNLGNERPENVHVGLLKIVLDRMGKLEDDFFRYAEGEEILAKADGRPIDEGKLNALLCCGNSLQADLDYIQGLMTEVGIEYQIPRNIANV
jgi:hypothetical protein